MTVDAKTTKPSAAKRHDPVTGALLKEPNAIEHSASDWKKYLNSKEHYDHPFGYMSGIQAFVGCIGSGKSSCIHATISELDAISNMKHRAGILYYSGSPGDRVLEQYHGRDDVELFDPSSKESFLTRIRGILNDASERAVSRQRGEKDDDLPKHWIIVLEDAIDDPDLCPQSQRTESPISRLLVSVRHVPSTILISSQKMVSLPTFVRANAGHWYLFSPRSDGEKRDILKIVNFSRRDVESSINALDTDEFLHIDQRNRKITKGWTLGLIH